MRGFGAFGVFGVAAAMGSGVVQAEDSGILEQSEKYYRGGEVQAQVTSVSEFRDVRGTDWAITKNLGLKPRPMPPARLRLAGRLCARLKLEARVVNLSKNPIA